MHCGSVSDDRTRTYPYYCTASVGIIWIGWWVLMLWVNTVHHFAYYTTVRLPQLQPAVCRFCIKASSQIFADYLQNVGRRFGSIRGEGRPLYTVVGNPRTQTRRHRSFCFQIGFITIIPRHRHPSAQRQTTLVPPFVKYIIYISFHVLITRMRCHWLIEKFDIYT